MAMAMLLNGPHPQEEQEWNGSGPQDEKEECYASPSPLCCGEGGLSISFTCHNARLFLTLLGISSAGGGAMSDPVGSAPFLLMKAGPDSWWWLCLKAE